MKCNKILVALSGGVDSSVCVHLMKEQGHDVTGLVLHLSPAHNSTVEAAQAAADEYLAQIRTANADTERRCAEMVAQAQARCDAADEEIRQKWAAFEQDVQRYLQAHDELKNFLGR